MNKKTKKNLSLSRETLRILNGTKLGDVHGGFMAISQDAGVCTDTCRCPTKTKLR